MSTNFHRSTTTTTRAVALLVATLAAVLSLLVAGAPSYAAEKTEAQGWARVAHLSPDTKSVDVALTAVAGGQILFDLTDVAYGDVSDYLRLPVGTYLVEMTPTGSPENATPAISEVISVKEGQPITLAVLGKNADITTKVIDDDLTPPADGEARVRVVQASTVADSVDITTTAGMSIASGAAKGQVTGYATVTDGPWDLELTGGSLTNAAKVDLASGSVSTLLVLDNASGGLTIKAISDSGSLSDTPVGGTNTGAQPVVADTAPTSVLILSGLGAAALLSLLVVRRAQRHPAPARRR